MILGDFLYKMKKYSNPKNQGKFVMEFFSAMCGEEDPINANQETTSESKGEFKSSDWLPDALKSPAGYNVRKHLFSSYKKYKPLSSPMKEYILGQASNKTEATFVRYLDNTVSEKKYSSLCTYFEIPNTIARTELFMAIYQQVLEFAKNEDDNVDNIVKKIFMDKKNEATNISVNKINKGLELLKKLERLGEYELLSDLENINKPQETLKALLGLLDKYKCIKPYPHDIRKYMKEAKEFFSSKEIKFYDSEIIRTVNKFHSTYDKFEEYLVTYYDKLKQIGKDEKYEQDERVIIEKRESLPIEMEIRQDLFISAIRQIIMLEGKLENTARTL